jgi:signal transduction histidine kinase
VSSSSLRIPGVNTLAVRTSAVADRLQVRSAHGHALMMLGVVGVGVCGIAMALAASGPATDGVDRALREGLIVGVPIAAGLYAARSPRDARFGFLLIGAGFVYSLTALGETTESLPYSIGRVAAWLVFPLLYYLMLAFPDGRLARRDRALLGWLALLVMALFISSALFVDSFPKHTPWATCDADCPANAFQLVDHEPALMHAVVTPVREALALLVLAGVVVSLVEHLRRATWLRRRLMSPVALMGVVATAILIAFLVARRVGDGSAGARELGIIWSLCIPAIAAAFLIGILQRRLLVGLVLRRLSAELRRAGDGQRLRAALAVALDDTSIDLLIADGAPGRWRDTDGRPASRAQIVAQGQATTIIDDGGVPVAALVHDRALRDDDDMLSAVGSLILAALQQEQLTSRLETSLVELEDSRSRIAAAADLERSRIERDLHDGAQQRLIKIRIGLSLAEELIRTDPDGASEAVRELGDEIEVALDEVRSLAHGVYPSLLSDRGIEDALRSVATESRLPVHFEVSGLTRLPAEIETAVYFTCVEALQNANKHGASATRVWITLRQGDALSFRVRDDGPGFVPPARELRGGLRNMRDRVEAVGGSLTIDASPAHGTIVRGVVPLGDDPTGRTPAGRFRRAARSHG